MTQMQQEMKVNFLKTVRVFRERYKIIYGQSQGHIPPPVRSIRNFLHESEQALMDCINYCVFQILRQEEIKLRTVTF